MKKVPIVLTLFLTLTVHISGQKDKARITNVEMDVVDNKVRIYYDVLPPNSTGSHQVDLKFITQDFRFITPSSLSGDFGVNVTPGKRKMIEWNVISDMNTITGKIRPTLYLDGFNPDTEIKGSPKNAFFSVLIPGFGDYFVKDHRDMFFKPYYRTLSSWSLIALGIYANNKRYRDEGYYMKWTQYVNIRNDYSWELRLVERESWVEGDMNYWLFKGDSEFFISTGIIIWVYDIIWVAAIGSTNEKLRHSLEKTNTSLNCIPGGLQLTCRLKF